MERNKTILVTGFDPFGSELINPSWEAVKMLPDAIGDWKIEKLMVKTVAYKSIDMVIDALNAQKHPIAYPLGRQEAVIPYLLSALPGISTTLKSQITRAIK